MELVILNPNLERVGTIDAFKSLIWTDRYFECGEFELLTSPTIANMSLVNSGMFALLKESEHFMLLEDVNIVTDPVEGNQLSVKGRSGGIILDRRVVWNPTKFQSTSIQVAILQLLNENALNPTNTKRKINLLEFEASANPAILEITTNNQYWGDSLYSAIVDLCLTNGIGFKVILTDEGKYRFNLYIGVDRSYDQVNNPYIVFSPNYENLKNSTYISTDRLLKTACLTAGEKGVGNAQECVEALISDKSDLDRREMFLDAQDVSKVDFFGNPISDEDYTEHLYERGIEELSKNTSIKSFSSEVDPTANFVYGTDFFLGDVLQVENEYGYQDRCRVIEVTRAQDESGIKVYPIFTSVPLNKYIEERVRLRKYLGTQLEFNKNINLSKSLGIDIVEEVTEY